jgi:transcriptional regulator with XRE-family HTH domain
MPAKQPAKKQPAKRRAARSPGEVFAAELKHVRLVHGWSQERLSKQLEAVGYPMDRTTIAKIETGRRPVSLDEAFALSAALDVSLKGLVLPHEHGANLALTPNIRASAFLVALWLKGHMPLSEETINRARGATPESIGDATRIYLTTTTFDEWRAMAQRPGVLRVLQLASRLELRAVFPSDDEESRQSIREVLNWLDDAVRSLRSDLDVEEATDGKH